MIKERMGFVQGGASGHPAVGLPVTLWQDRVGASGVMSF